MIILFAYISCWIGRQKNNRERETGILEVRVQKKEEKRGLKKLEEE